MTKKTMRTLRLVYGIPEGQLLTAGSHREPHGSLLYNGDVAADPCPAEWEDSPLPEDDEIAASHPVRTHLHGTYAEAMRLVGARRLARATVLVEEGHRERCLRCMSAIAKLSKDESGPDDTVEVFEVFEVFR
jgi:hypothetical protein